MKYRFLFIVTAILMSSALFSSDERRFLMPVDDKVGSSKVIGKLAEKNSFEFKELGGISKYVGDSFLVSRRYDLKGKKLREVTSEILEGYTKMIKDAGWEIGSDTLPEVNGDAASFSISYKATRGKINREGYVEFLLSFYSDQHCLIHVIHYESDSKE